MRRQPSFEASSAVGGLTEPFASKLHACDFRKCAILRRQNLITIFDGKNATPSPIALRIRLFPIRYCAHADYCHSVRIAVESYPDDREVVPPARGSRRDSTLS